MNSLNRYEGYVGTSTKSMLKNPTGDFSRTSNAPGIWSILDKKNCVLASAAKNNNLAFAAAGVVMTTRSQSWRDNTLVANNGGGKGGTWTAVLEPLYANEIP